MQLSISTDYAIRVLLSLEKTGNRKTSLEIVEQMVIPERYILKIINKLRKNDIIKSFSGSRGGYELTRELSQITLGEVITIMEKSICINRCLQKDAYCSRNASDICKIRKFYSGLQKEIQHQLNHVSIQDILSHKFESVT